MSPSAAEADFVAGLLGRYRGDPARAQALHAALGQGRRDVVLRFALGLPAGIAAPAPGGDAAAARLAEDATLFLRHCLARDDASHYDVLCLAPDASAEAVRENFRLLMQLIHPDRQDGCDPWPEGSAARVNRAYAALKTRETRAAYDRELASRHREATARAAAAARPGTPSAGKRAAVHRSRLRGPFVPEWLSAGLADFVRARPVASSLAMIVVGSASIIAALAWESRDATLTRDVAPRVAADASATPGPRRPGTAGLGASRPAVAIADYAPGAERIAASVAVDRAAAPAAKVEAAAPAAVAAARSSATPGVPVRGDTGAAREGGPVQGGAQAAPLVVTTVAEVAASATPVPVSAPVPVAAALPVPAPLPVAVPAPDPTVAPPATAEIEAFFAAFVESYEKGRADAIAALFDDEADANHHHGRAAIRGEYDEIFRLSSWRRMQLTRINWRRAGDRAHATGEISVRIGWRDGREVEQRLAVDMELVRRDGRAVVARLAQQPRN